MVIAIFVGDDQEHTAPAAQAGDNGRDRAGVEGMTRW
jgi:hypothetical protein